MCYPAFTDEDLGYIKDDADEFCERARRRAGVPGLPRTFIFRNLNNVRKHQLKS